MIKIYPGSKGITLDQRGILIDIATDEIIPTMEEMAKAFFNIKKIERSTRRDNEESRKTLK